MAISSRGARRGRVLRRSRHGSSFERYLGKNAGMMSANWRSSTREEVTGVQAQGLRGSLAGVVVREED
jgi:hypothetical protein